MLPIGKVRSGKDWMEIFTVVVWGTVILIMFLSKLKAFQDCLIAIIIGTIMLIMNADVFFSRLRMYKVYFVIKGVLKWDLGVSFAVVLGCLILHGIWPEAYWPGVLMHLLAFGAWIGLKVQASPLLTLGLYFGGRNQMTRTQMILHLMAQVGGITLAFVGFSLWYSFKYPGEGPFHHFFGIGSACAAIAVFLLSVAMIRVQDEDKGGKEH
uniref:Uncharacterized protein n=1 Tax=Noctiluca scintillans TaxID=2966 RepID=A0A7S1FFQ3_NOCSC|mmetsp:Transcript_6073/g.17009  ORF Transcript_6073/g.17009 Transcript_6073/m.17009 type:complete len:210 (+) Transcript_6073:62-691(+)